MRSGLIRRYKLGLASSLVIMAAVASLVAYALSASGYAVHKADLNDGGVWVTSAHDGEFARLNKPVGQLDGAMFLGANPSTGHSLDIVQAGTAVAAWDQTSGQLAAVDGTAMSAIPGHPASLPQDAAVAIGGDLTVGTLAVLDTQTGHLWGMRIDTQTHLTDLSSLDKSSRPLDAKIGSASALAVSHSGTIFAISRAGQLTTIRPSGTGFSQPQVDSLPALSTDPQITAVGDTPVVLAGNSLIVLGHQPITVPGSRAVLQQAGAATPQVLVATSTSLYSVSVDNARVQLLSRDGNGSQPSAPVQLGGCNFAAWTGAPAIFRNSCPSVGKTDVGRLTVSSTNLVYRVNRQQLVLNDPDTGNVWNVDGATAQQVADWSAVAPPPKPANTNRTDTRALGVSLRKQPPKAVADSLGARPGRTTTLHVLDNDSDPAGRILAIDHVSRPDNPAATLVIAADEQTIAITLPASVTAPVHFTYEINDGTGQHATAAVLVTPTLGNANQAPKLCTCFVRRPWSVGVSSAISLPVVGSWRDGDGDPITLTAASTSTSNGASIEVTQYGDLVYQAPRVPPAGGLANVSYTVIDGFGGISTGTLTIRILAANATIGTPPIASPDVAQAIVGQSVTIRPLDNDLPGTDPTSADPQLRLASPVAPQPGATIISDLQHATVTFTATKAMPFLLPYTISYGAQSASGEIRVDVTPPPRTAAPIVAMPDTATLYGQQPTIVDVLANDYDPSGNVLVLQQAVPTDPTSGLQATVVNGRWISVVSTNTAPSAHPQLLRYTVTDGLASATGEVAITERPASTQVDQPVAVADHADVRAGDIVSIPVLDNDIDPDGAMLSIAPNSVQVVSGGGQAFVTGNIVRYVAPSGTAADSSATLTYTATNGAASNNGTVTITIHPLLADAAATDAPPVPLPIVTNVVAGSSVVISIPTTGVDPDGDSVTLTGIDAPGPHLGAITAMTADSLTYQAFPNTDNAGTDTIGYRVVDRFGKPGTSYIRIGVVQPGPVQPPVANNDSINGAPGAQLAVNVVANDVITPGAVASVTINGNVSGAHVDATNKSVIDVTAPDAGRTVVVPYLLDDGSGTKAAATLTVHGITGYDNPPVARDDSATPVSPTATTVTVPVLSNDSDPDLADHLTVVKTYSSSAAIVGNKVRLTLTRLPQTVVYVVSDGRKTSAAVIFVPAAGAGVPYVKPGSTIQIPAGKPTTVDINTYLIDPARKTLITTYTDKQIPEPAGMLSMKAVGSKLTLTGQAGFAGPANVTLQVTDGATPSAVGAATGYVSIPVQIGQPVPVLRCPTMNIATLYQGGAESSIDVPTVCQVWLPKHVSIDSVNFTARLQRSLPGVSVSMSGSRTVVLAPSNLARPGDQGVLEVGIANTSQHQAMPFSIQAMPLLVLDPIVVSGVKINESKTISIQSYAHSQFRTPNLKVLSCTRTTGLAAACTPQGAALVVQPGDSARGTITFAVRVTDEPTDPARTVTGLLTLTVLGRPAAPPSVTANANRTQGGEVQVSWPSPAYDGGAPIDYYTITYSGGSSGTKRCTSSPCVVTGLTNGLPYTFAVASHNGANEVSPPPDPRSNAVTPDAKPDQVTGVTVSKPVGNQSLTITWAAPHKAVSPTTHYLIQITDLGPQGSGTTSTTIGPTPTFTTTTPLHNDDQYQFSVAAENGDGIGPYSSPVLGQSAGQPAPMPAPSVPAEQPTQPSANVSAAITWSPETDPNGPAITSYAVYRGVGSQAGATALPQCTAVAPAAVMTCSDTVANSGTKYYYAIVATNGAALTSTATNFQEFDAVGMPGQITSVVAAASANPGAGPQTDTGPGYDGAIRVTFTVPAANGSAIQAIQYSLNGGAWTSFPGSSWTSGQQVTEPISGLVNGTAYSVSVQAKNETYTGSPSPASNTVYPYGPPPTPTVNATASGTYVTYSWSCSTNGRPISACQVSIDGGALAIVTPDPVTYNRGYQYAYSIRAVAVDSANQTSPSSATVSGSTPAVPAPSSSSCGGSGLSLQYNWNSSGPGLTYEFAWNGGGYQNNGGSTSTTQTGSNYSTSYGISVYATDGTHNSSVYSFSCSTGPPPPPPPSVTVSRGAQTTKCGSTCYYIHVQTANFSGSVTCSFDSAYGNGGFISETYGANDSRDSYDYYGWPGTWVSATCGGVTGKDASW